MLPDHLLAVVVGDEVGRLRAVHGDVVPERTALLVEALVERRSAERDDARVGPDVEHVRVERRDPDHCERAQLHDFLRRHLALRVVRGRRRAFADHMVDLDLAAVELVVRVDEVGECLHGGLGVSVGPREALRTEDGVDLLVRRRLEPDDVDGVAGDAVVRRAAVVAGEHRLAGRVVRQEDVELKITCAVRRVAGRQRAAPDVARRAATATAAAATAAAAAGRGAASTTSRAWETVGAHGTGHVCCWPT